MRQADRTANGCAACCRTSKNGRSWADSSPEVGSIELCMLHRPRGKANRCSTSIMVDADTLPNLRPIPWMDERTWSVTITFALVRPALWAGILTCAMIPLSVPVIGATKTRLAGLSFITFTEAIRAGRTPPCSCPIRDRWSFQIAES
jgi:hypothetical protein